MYIIEEMLNYFLIKQCWSCKYKNLLYTLNVYKIPRKEHQVVDIRVTDKVEASETLF